MAAVRSTLTGLLAVDMAAVAVNVAARKGREREAMGAILASDRLLEIRAACKIVFRIFAGMFGELQYQINE